WITYALLEAGRLWCRPQYTQVGQSLGARILREEVALIPGLGATLLPAPRGFVENQTWRLNASYMPIQALRGIGRHSGDRAWRELVSSSVQVIQGSAPKGFVADWIAYRKDTGFLRDEQTLGSGSYDAIRVYLWVGMLPQPDEIQVALTQHLAPMIAAAAKQAAPPETVDTQTLRMSGEGPHGFSAALLPMLSNAGLHEALARHRTRAEAAALHSNRAYYNDALTLFGLGWLDGRYRFQATGLLELKWRMSCDAPA
ncbi:MAG TPA: cellulose synthase complex periplasmic endoglucanase BcsZ, partial [Povalibacter sp.]|nr:cellulose synthase complex periplasmic endoglucanase BcsZ [Povalibacter sp.]